MALRVREPGVEDFSDAALACARPLVRASEHVLNRRGRNTSWAWCPRSLAPGCRFECPRCPAPLDVAMPDHRINTILAHFRQQCALAHGTPGAIAVLHTHSRRLDYHPHVHVVMPAAAIDAKRRLWRTRTHRGKQPWLFPHKALAKVFRAKLLDALAAAKIAVPRHPAKWVVDCQHVGTGAKALVYLGRYLYRGVIREKDILACRDGQVTFRYQDSQSRRWQTRTLPGADFLWLVLRHVLPRRFRRARNFGFLHPNSKRMLELVQLLLRVGLAAAITWFKPRPALTCPACGGTLHIIRTQLPPALAGPRHPPDGIRGCMLM